MSAKKIVLKYWHGLKKDSPAAHIVEHVEHVARRSAGTPARVLMIARAQSNRGDDANAIETLTSGLIKFKDDVDIQYRAAFLLEKNGRLAEARELYLGLIQRPGTSGQISYRLAVTLQRLGQTSEALSWALNYSTSFPEDARGSRLAFALAAKEPLWRRLEILSNAKGELAHNAEWQADLIALAYNMRRYQVCVDRYQAVRGRVKRRTIAHVVASLMELDRVDEAWNTGADYLSQSERSADLKHPGLLMQDLGSWNFAKRLHEISYQKTPSIRIAYLVGFSSSRLFEWQDASDWFRASLPGNPDEKKVRYYLGLALERQERWTEAAGEYFRAATTFSPHNYRIYRAINCLHSAKDVEAGKAALDHLQWNTQSGDGDTVVEIFDSVVSQASLHRVLQDALTTQRVTAIEYVAGEALNAQLWGLAVEASKALVERSVVHKPENFHLLARALMGEGSPEAALEAYLSSRIHREPTIVAHATYEKSRITESAMRFGSFRRHCELDASSVLYESNHGSKLTCNVLPLVRAMTVDPRFRDWTHYVVLPNRSLLPDDLQYYPNIIVVSRESDLYVKKLATASWVINNNTFPTYYIRRDGQRYLNLWHGTPIKSMGKDIKNGNFDYRNAARNFLHVTHFALPNVHTRDQLVSRYGISGLYRGHVELTGSPRMDSTLRMPPAEVKSVREYLGLGPGDKAILYVPTWRGELGNVESSGVMDRGILDRIESAGFRALYRGHPVSSGSTDDQTPAVNMVPESVDTNVLLACVDAVVSDYSSVVFDAALSGVPVGLFAYDESDYRESRGLSVELEDLNLPVLRDFEQLDNWLSSLVFSKCISLDKEFTMYEDGCATSRVLDLIADPGPQTLDIGHRNNILLFEGHFIPNGITSAATQLNAALKEANLSVTVAVEPGAISPYVDRYDAFLKATADCEVLPRIAGSIDTAEQRWLIDRQHQGHALTPTQLACVHSAFVTEFERLYGTSEFDVAVGFEGFSLYWSNLMAAAKAERKVGYLHADMTKEAMARFPYLWKVFETYRYFDVLACVSPDVLEVNQINLKQWTDGGTFIAAENLINIKSIVTQAKAPVDQEFLAFTRRFAYKFVAVGRISIEKGSDRLIEAFLEVANANSNVGLVVVGDGPLRMQMERKVQLSGLSDRVFFTGQLDSPFGYMDTCDALVMASHYEGQGIVVLEAFALGLDVLSVDIPGPRSLLRPGSGLLVEDSVVGLTKGMQEMLNGFRPRVRFDVEAYDRMARVHAIEAITGRAVSNGYEYCAPPNRNEVNE